MATNAKDLQAYFAEMDAAEEADARLAGVTPDEYREAALPSTGPLAALGRATWEAEDLRRARSTYAKRGMDLPEHLRVKEAPEAAPIPVKTAPPNKDVAAPTVSVREPVTADKPAGKPESMGTQGLPAPSSEGAGGDALGRLSLGQALTRALEGSGSIIAGRDLRSGAADTLGERMKQIEALRAKREEQKIEQAKARAEAAAASKVTGEMLQSLGITPPPSLAELPSPELVLKAGKFPAEVAGIQALTSQRTAGAKVAEARLPLLGGQAALADARTQVLLNKDQRDERAMQLREEAQDYMNELRKAQAESARAAALKAKNDPKASEAAVNSVKKTVEASRKLVTPTANNFLAIERVAPGMSRGEAPGWLTREAMAGTQVSKELAPKVADLNAAVEALVMDIRHGTFGASLTGTEKASFEQLITNSIKDGPEALARALNQLRQRAAQIAQDHFSFDMDFHPQETSRALRASDIWKQALAEGGIYSDVWQIPETAPTAGGMTRMIGPDNQKYDVPNDKVEAAKAKGWRE